MIGTKIILAGALALVSVAGNVLQGLKIHSLKSTGPKVEKADKPKRKIRMFWQKKFVEPTVDAQLEIDVQPATETSKVKKFMDNKFGRLFRKASPEVVPA